VTPVTSHSPSVEAAELDLDTVKAILHAHVPGREVWAFGSRARRAAKPYSDLDLVIMGDAPLSLDALAALNEAFAESDLPWKVDVVDWARLGDAFRRIVERDRVVLQRVEDAGTDQHHHEPHYREVHHQR
jgi:predicted nucleotidyltransferase